MRARSKQQVAKLVGHHVAEHGGDIAPRPPGQLVHSHDVASDGRFIVIASAPLYGRTPINVVLNWTRLLTAKK